MMECAPVGAVGKTFGNTELSQKAAQIMRLHSPEMDGRGRWGSKQPHCRIFQDVSNRLE